MAEKKVSKTINEDGTLTFVFAGGEEETVNPGDFDKEIQKHLLIHGVSQKLGDSYSGEDADKCHIVFMAVLKNLQEGNWSARSGGGGGTRISQLAEALAKATGQEVDVCVQKLAEMDDDQKKAVRAHPQVQAAIAEIKLAKAQADAKAAAEAAGGEVAPLEL